MSRITRCRLVLFVTLPVAIVRPCFAQMNQANDANVQRVTVSGTVVNSETNEPIPGALVEMMQFAMLTDDRGQFRFDGVPMMATQISAMKPGYFGPEQLGSWNPQMLDITDRLGSITVKLVPEGIIFGQVSSPDSEPLDGVPVQVIQAQIQNGVKIWQHRGVSVTDDEGHFRITELQPGPYYLLAGPSGTTGPLVGAASGRTQGYGEAFYPSSPDMASATPIVITPGKRMQADFSLPRQQFYRVSGTLIGIPPNRNLSIQLWSADGATANGVQLNRQTGVFRSNFVAPGSYVLYAISQGPPEPGQVGTRDVLSAQLSLNVNSEITNLHLALAPAPAIPVNFLVDSASKPQGPRYEPVHIQFYSLDKPAPMNGNFVPRMMLTGSQDDPQTVIRGGQPGRYGIEFYPRGDFYIASATFGNVDLLRDDFVIGDEPAAGAMEIVLHDGPGTLHVKVSLPPADVGLTVFLVPDDFPNLLQTTRTDSGGMAQFANLTPGSYRVFALDRAEDLEYRKPGTLQEFLSGASRVTISENQTASVTVPLIRREN
jgi:hypothetical protein